MRAGDRKGVGGLQGAGVSPGGEGVVNGNRVWAKARGRTGVLWERGSTAVRVGAHAEIAGGHGAGGEMWEKGWTG